METQTEENRQHTEKEAAPEREYKSIAYIALLQWVCKTGGEMIIAEQVESSSINKQQAVNKLIPSTKTQRWTQVITVKHTHILLIQESLSMFRVFIQSFILCACLFV